MEREQGDPERARHWYQQAIGSGHPEYAPCAMTNLGAVEISHGHTEQARHWCKQAIDTGHPDHAPRAMVNLGILESEQGDPEQARHWWQQATRHRPPRVHKSSAASTTRSRPA
jgi:Tfp pilus assembly protein PilF